MTFRPVRTVAGTLGVAAVTGAAFLAPAALENDPAQAAGGGLTSRAYFNWPGPGTKNPAATRALIARINGAPKGSQIKIATFSLTDSNVSVALVKAHTRGVSVKYALSGGDTCWTKAANLLRRGIGTNLQCIKGSREATSRGGLHSKFFLFTNTGGTKNVTMVGSMNPTMNARDWQYADLYQYAGRPDVYDAYNKVFGQIFNRRNFANPYTVNHFNDGAAAAWFYPVGASRTDPVLTRLRLMPDGPGTHIRVNNMSIWGDRGKAIIAELRRKQRSGSHIRVMVGPMTSAMARDEMRKSPRINFRNNFDKGCNPKGANSVECRYTHLKAMTASWVDGKGVRQYRSWTGSDNWGPDGLKNDEVVQKVGGKAAYDQYVGFLDRAWNVSR